MRAPRQARFYRFDERPLADSCWSLSTGPDGRIYAAACVEHVAGETGTVVRYDEAGDRLEYLYDLDRVSGDPRDSGRATQCKVHYSFAPDAAEGLLYSATHLSGPPKGESSYCPWSAWHDEARAFRGSMLTAWDTAADEARWCKLMIPKEGCRCLAFDPDRRRLYAITYPRDHFVWYDLDRHELTDRGRIGSVNTQCLFLDRRRRVFWFDDRGRLLRYDPDTDRLEDLPHTMPHAAWQTGWHGVLYDAVDDPAGESVFLLPWMVGPRLARYWPAEGPHGRLEDLGPVTQARDEHYPMNMSLDHAGGLVCGADGGLYFARARWPAETLRHERGDTALHGEVLRLDPETLARETVATLAREDGAAHYVTRGARDAAGNLYFGHVGRTPVGFFRLPMPGAGERTDAHLPLRLWG